MSFYFKGVTTVTAPKHKVSTGTLHKLGCRGCSLGKERIGSPEMPPTGANKPLVYMLGEAPGRVEDDQDKPFVGDSGQFLRARIPRKYRDQVRLSNCVRCRPPKNRNPEWNELESCRPSIIKDIEETKPLAVFGLGGIPLRWTLNESKILTWRGRRTPVKIGEHVCWYYPMLHPAFIIRGSRRRPENSDLGKVFIKDMERAFDELKTLPDPVIINKHYENIRIFDGSGSFDLEIISTFLNKMRKEESVGVDLETNCLRPYSKGAKIITASVGTKDEVIAFALRHKRNKWPGKELKKLEAIFGKFLRDSKCIKFAHNLPFEMEWISFFYGNECLRNSPWGDTMAQAYVLDERKNSSSLDFLCLQHFGFNLKALSNLDRKNLDNAPLPDVLRYNALDTKYTHHLSLVQMDLVEAEGLRKVYDVQIRRASTIVLTQQKGINIDQKTVKRFQDKLRKRIEPLEEKIAELEAVKEYEQRKQKKFNPGSNQQVLYVFKNMLKCGEVIDEKTGKSSVGESILSKIKHPLAKFVLLHRELTKLKSTYVDNFEQGVGSDVYPDGLAHSQLNTMFTATGRTSSEAFNQQNFVKHKNKWVREEIVAADNCVLVSADYGQIEAKVFGMASEDKFLCKALWEDYDIHADWAKRIANKYPKIVGGKKFISDNDVMKELRQKVKNKFVFPAFFGAAGESIAEYLGVPESIFCGRNGLLKEFWDTFPEVKQWQNDLLDFYNEHGYTETLTNRRRRAPMSVNQLLNHPIQGTASDIVINAMDRLSEFAEEENMPQLQAIMNVHDDLTFNIPVDSLDDDLEDIIDQMLDVPFDFINVPISIEVEVGHNWFAMKKVGTFKSN
ncbi:hypothetical protein LCGC14_0231680 [marine sediment metagenome]|uniref:DNA-directed DNA polymerase family A palm domain-containing protein n=1 Tax=marine sediment metagenome TaxID=412755 RepID=A0A0F9UA36_9ZZZZ